MKILMRAIMIACLLLPSSVLAVVANANSDSSIVKIDIVGEHILMSDGTLWTFKVVNRAVTMDKLLDKVVDVSTGNGQTLALRQDKTVWAWGINGYGERGDDQYIRNPKNGDVADFRAEPLQIQGLTDITAISAANRFSMALKSDGTVWTWGSNLSGGLGDGTRSAPGFPSGESFTSTKGTRYLSGQDRYQPLMINTLSNVIAIDNFGQGGVALRADGTVWAWSSFIDQLSPYQIPGLEYITTVKGTFATNKANEVWGWGLNDRGQYGNGVRAEDTFFEFDPVPTRLQALDHFQQIEVGISFTIGLKDSQLYSWGGNDQGSLGDGKTTVRVKSGGKFVITEDHDRLTPAVIEAMSDVQQIWSGHTTLGGYVLMKNGEVWMWSGSMKGSVPKALKFINGPLAETKNTSSQHPKAENPTPTTKNNYTIIFDGQTIPFDQPPVEVKGRVMVPLRAIFDALHADVTWDKTTSTATAMKGNMKIILTVGQLEARINGIVVKLDQPADIINNRVMVPVRFVTETFGGKVSLDINTKTITITTK